MSDERESIDRRSYLKLSGVAGVTTLGLAGCLEDSGNGNGNGNGDGNGNGNGDTAENGDGNGNGDGNETGNGDGNESGNGDGNESGNGDGNESGNGDGNESGNGDSDETGGEIVAGTAPGFPPFEMTEDGELVGFDIDLLEAVVAETEYELAGWEDLEFDSLQPALQNGNIDVIAAALSITEERQESIAFSDPYYSADQAVLVAEGGDFQPEELSDLEGQAVGTQSGTTGEGVVEDELGDDADHTPYDNYVLAVEDLERGVIDAVVLDEPVAETFAGNRDVEVAFVYETGEEYGFGVRQDDEELQSALSEGLAAVEESGEYDEITQEWFGE